MRLDLFLKITRLSPRRAVAQRLCGAGFVSLNGRAAKAAHLVKPGDEIGVRQRDREITVRVLKVPLSRHVSRRDASLLIETVNERELQADL